MSDITVSPSFSRNQVRAQSATNKKFQHFDDVIRAAQSLFARDIWVSGLAVSKELGVSQTSITIWIRRGSLVGNVIASYQRLQRELGVKTPQASCKRHTKH